MISKYMGTASVRGNFGDLYLAHGQHYEAVEVHITAPSLHMINGTPFAAEMLIMHKPQGTPDLLNRSVIVSVLFEETADGISQVFNGFGFTAHDSPIIENIPAWTAPGAINLPSDVYNALGGPAYLYNGSVPVPPCTENVNWFILGDAQPIGKEQVDQLRRMLRRHVPGVEHRRTYPRKSSLSECRRLEVNRLDLGGSHEGPTCEAALAEGKAYLSARCWDYRGHCFSKPFSAADIMTANAVQPSDGYTMRVEEFMHYKPVTNLQVRPSDYSVYASVPNHGDMGHLMLKGHIFFAHNISVKPISSHTIDGVRYEAEVTIEHVMFGDTYGKGLPSYIDDVHIVTSVFLLKRGRHSEFLADLGIGDDNMVAAIRDGTHYDVEETMDLGTLLEPALSGPWYWYSSNSTHPGCGHSIRWMVFETPLEASMEQLNALQVKVSGVDSSQLSNPIPYGYVWKQHFPSFAVEANETACGNLPQTEFHYGEERPLWTYGNERCWNAQYPICGDGISQSPIDVPTSGIAEGTDNFLHKISWKPVSQLRVGNTGHNVQVNNGLLGYTELIGQNGFPDYYQVAQFHLHMPSEHMIGGKQFAAELHIVHKKQNSVGDLADDYLLVTGIMFDFGRQESPLLHQLFLGNETMIFHEGQHATLRQPLDLARAVGPVINGPFYRYDGGLTTPPCSEVVKWFVFETPLSMTIEQWLSFKKLYPNPSNNRPIQPLNGRKVSKNSMAEGALLDYRFYLNRDEGRNRIESDSAKIIIPIIGTVLISVAVMCSMWMREEGRRRRESAVGLVAAVLGKTEYSQLPDRTPKA